LYARFDLENSLPASVANVNMYGPMLVAVKEKFIPILLENLRHMRKLAGRLSEGQRFCSNY
jgi:hypothetical protein